MKYSLLFLLFCSLVSFAIEVGQDIELTNYMNARYSARFTKDDNNIMGALEKGTKGTVREVKKFLSGNSGFLIEVQDGALKSQKVWVYYNEKKPSLALLDKDQKPVVAADAADVVQATAVTPVTREPASGTGITMSTADRAVADLAKLNKVPSDSDCSQCNQAEAPAAKLTSSKSAAGDISARLNCSYKGAYGAIPGTIDVEIENNIVKNINATIDGCSVTSAEFKQVFFDNKNIVLKNAQGCTVVLSDPVKVKDGVPVISFGMVPDEPCVKFCPKIERHYWQAEMNPNTQTCY